MKGSVDLTYSGKLKGMLNAIVPVELDVNYTIEGNSGDTTTTSILLEGDAENFLMFTFNFQDLKKLVEGVDDKSE